MIGLLGLAWGVVAGLPFFLRARKRAVAHRTLRLRRASRRRSDRPGLLRRGIARCASLPPVATTARVLRVPHRVRAGRRRDDDLARELAIVVDLVGVGVSAGCTPYTAVELAARWSPTRMRRALDDVVRACRLGQSFDDALRELGVAMTPTRALTDTLRTTARLGAPVAPALTRLATDVRADLRRRAEARARTVPVRLCFPLVGCILPAFALLTVVPVVLDGLHR